ncbi:MAG: dicarboxylate transporter/tellurite-resistance protein TehA [Phycisphaerae bacterium]|nr:dicarboxylate transporter/tellurite-resistance protein TehA [Gemmatimonadaceae bacterium]
MLRLHTPELAEYRVESGASASERGAFPGRVPAAFFAIAVGLFGLGNDWRAAAGLWRLPSVIGEVAMVLGTLLSMTLTVLYAAKWVWARESAREEWSHPVQCCFVGLMPASWQLAGLALRPYGPAVANTLFWIGVAGYVAFMVDRIATLWSGGRNPLATTPVLYLPAVAGSFITSIVAAAFGYPTIATISFGAGFFSWLALESVLLHRLLVHEPLDGRLVPTLGIQLAPPTVGCVAYLGITTGPADPFALMLFGYGLLQALVLVRLTPRFVRQPFAPSFWAFSFGAASLALAAVRIAARSDGHTGITRLAIGLFVAANVVVGAILVRTILLVVRGRLLPPAPIAVSAVGFTPPS